MIRSSLGRCSFVALALVVSACKSPSSGNGHNEVELSVSSNVTWPKAESLDRLTLRSYPPSVVDNVAHSPVPVLLPNGITFAEPVLITRSEYYAFSGRAVVDGHPDANYTVHATKLAHAYEGTTLPPGDKAMRGTMGFLTINEGIRVASWSENGVAYSVDIECPTEDDARCIDEAHIVDLVNRLAFVGGGAR